MFAIITISEVFQVACGCITVSLSLILGTLLGWHVYLILHNMTTIEVGYHALKLVSFCICVAIDRFKDIVLLPVL